MIAIVGPLGIALDDIISTLEEELRRVGYRPILIRLSSLIYGIEGLKTRLIDEPEHERIESHMDAGTEIRTRTGIGGMLARLAIAAIQRERQKITGSAREPARRHAYILRSLKHRHEVQDLRDVYGDGLIIISAYAPKSTRESALRDLLAKSNPSGDKAELETAAKRLIERDEAEEGISLGQNVGGAFPLADLFVEASSRTRLEKSIRRFIEAMFGNHFITPQIDEFGMFQANAVAKRSADLARQVGAVLATPKGEIIAVGCNDTPKAGGGQYWEGDDPDGRDFAWFGHDPTKQAERELVATFVKSLIEGGFLEANHSTRKPDDVADELIDNGHLDDTPVTSLLEFGRVLHAEMAALMDAARRGVSTADATLFSTTFPCHLCARLIIAAGIRRVVFVEPYPKSKTKDLYRDSVVIDDLNLSADKVNFQSFVGVAPRRYDQLFQYDPRFQIRRRKSQDGSAAKWKTTDAEPRIRRFQFGYIDIEFSVVARLEDWLGTGELTIGS